MTYHIYRRPCTFYEKFFAYRTQKGFYTNFNITVELNTIITPTVLSNSLRQLVLQNPTLTLNFISDSHGASVAEPVGQILFDDVVTFTTVDHQFDETLLAKLNEEVCEISSGKPLWKVIVHQFKSIQYITVICEHSLFDGNSGVYFFKDLVPLLQENLVAEDFVDVLFDKNRDYDIFEQIPETTDRLVDTYDVSIGTFVKAFWLEVICPQWLLDVWYSYFDNNHPNVFKNPIFKLALYKLGFATQYKLFSLDQRQVEMILSYAKQNQLTFTPYMTSVASKTFQEVISPVVSPNTELSIVTNIVLNGRRFNPHLESKLKYNLCIGEADIILGPLGSDLLPSMNFAKQRLLQSLKSQYGFKSFGCLKYVNPKLILDGKIGSYMKSTMEISNLGNQAIATKDLTVENMWFSQDLGIAGNIGFSIVSGKRGMNVVVGVIPELFALEQNGVRVIDTFVERLKQNLVLYAREDKTLEC